MSVSNDTPHFLCTVLYIFTNKKCKKNIKKEAGSADTDAAKEFPAELKEIIREKGYKPEQVWKMDETG